MGNQLSCYHKTVMYDDDSFEIRTRRSWSWSEEVKQGFYQQNSTMTFAVPANVKLKLPTVYL
jgi:hypothetical protein